MASPDHGLLLGLTDDDHPQYLKVVDKYTDAEAVAAPSIQTWVPTYSNLTVGNGIVVARYQQVGKVVWFYFSLDFGTTSTMGTGPEISLPVTGNLPANDLTVEQNIMNGNVIFRDFATRTYVGTVHSLTNTVMQPRLQDIVTTYLRNIGVTATTPMTWVTNDRLVITGIYEAA